MLSKFVESVPSENIIGYLYYHSKIPPCYKCGMAKECQVGGLWQMLDRDEKRLKEWTLTENMFTRWEENSDTVTQVETFAQMLAAL